MNKNEVRGHLVAKRALEIAASGDHSIMLYGPRGVGKTTLAESFPEVLHLVKVDSCACGNTESIIRECYCNPTRLARWVRKSIQIASTCDIVIEVVHLMTRDHQGPLDHTYDSGFQQRVSFAREFGKTNTDMNFPHDSPAWRTWEMAMRKLALTFGDSERIKRVARTIANLAGSPTIEARHIAEAVQYKALRFPEVKFPEPEPVPIKLKAERRSRQPK